ncbi:hypothetical protein ACOME3_009942 [Neoechinorhynchus agilis]
MEAGLIKKIMIASQESAEEAKKMEERIKEMPLTALRKMSQEFEGMDQSVKRQAIKSLTASERNSLEEAGFLTKEGQPQGFQSGGIEGSSIGCEIPEQEKPPERKERGRCPECGCGIGCIYTPHRTLKEAFEETRRLMEMRSAYCARAIKKVLSPDLFFFGDERARGHPNWAGSRLRASISQIERRRRIRWRPPSTLPNTSCRAFSDLYDEATVPLSRTSVAGSSSSEAVVPPSTGDSFDWKNLSIYRLVTGSQKCMVEFALAVFSRRPDDLYQADSSLRGPAFRQGGFELAAVPLDTPYDEQKVFLDAFLAFYKDIARPCVLKSGDVSKYERAVNSESVLSAQDYYAQYVRLRKSCLDCEKKIGQSSSSPRNIHAWAHYLFNQTFLNFDMNDELSVREIFDTTKSDHTVRLKRDTSILLLIRALVAIQLFKLKLVPDCELIGGALVTELGIFNPTFEALTTRQARISMITRALLTRARAALATIFPDFVESVIGPPLPSPLTERKTGGDVVTVQPSESVSFSRSVLPEETLTSQDQLSAITRVFGASPADLLRSTNPTRIRAKFRVAVEKVLAQKRIEFRELLSQNQKQVESTRESLAKRPRDSVLLKILEELRGAQLKIDSSLALIERTGEEIQALSHLDDLPIMTAYNNDLDLESLPNSPVDLGTAFLAYMSRAKATLGEAEHVRVEKREI